MSFLLPDPIPDGGGVYPRIVGDGIDALSVPIPLYDLPLVFTAVLAVGRAGSLKAVNTVQECAVKALLNLTH